MHRTICVSATVFAAFVGLVSVTCPQDTKAAPPNHSSLLPGDKSDRTFLGLKDCYSCHTSGFPKSDVAAQFGILANDNWIMANEVETWGKKGDKHAQAYTSLLSDTGMKIGTAMGIPGAVSCDKRCLACHTGFPIAEMESVQGLLIDEVTSQKDGRITAGVSCEGCHGPAGGTHGWLSAHTNKDTWRFITPEEKSKKGFYDVRSVISRTRLCLSCHLGSAEQGRILTHEMYAAGHPPLPSFEIETFEQQMPKHWTPRNEKSPELHEELFKRTGMKINRDELYKTKSMLIAALISRSESLRLTADLAEGVVSEQIPKPQWPDFAQFDCYACHHDLKSESWRKTAQHAGSPGKPRLVPWPESLSRLAALQAHSDSAEVHREYSVVRSATLVSPFGDREALIEAARMSAEWSDKLAVALDGQEMTATEGAALLKSIVETAASETLDYDSARQLLWAFTIVETELKVPHERRADLDAVSKTIVLDLRRGRAAKHQIPGVEAKREVQEVNLSETLPPIAAYDALAFQRAFAALRDRAETPAPFEIPK